MSTPPRSGRRFRRLTFAAALLACAGPALAQTPAALPRLDVATTPGTQLLTGVAVEGLGNGNVTLLWNQLFTNGALTELARGRRFSAAGVPLGPDIVFQSSTSRPGGAAANVRGAAVLSWNRPRPGGGTDVVVRRTSPLFPTANLVANGPGALSRGPADVAIDRNGNFVAVWDVSTPSGIRVFGQRFNANGTKRGPEFNAVTSTDGNHGSARVAMNPATGEFVAVWVAASSSAIRRAMAARPRRSSPSTFQTLSKRPFSATWTATAAKTRVSSRPECSPRHSSATPPTTAARPRPSFPSLRRERR